MKTEEELAVIREQIKKITDRWERADNFELTNEDLGYKTPTAQVNHNSLEWIIKIEQRKNQRIRIVFSPITETVMFYGECRVKNNQWSIFSKSKHGMIIILDEIQKMIEVVVVEMRKRLQEYENINEGFNALKWVAFEGDESEDMVQKKPETNNNISGELIDDMI